MRELGGIFTLPDLNSTTKDAVKNTFAGLLTDSGRSAFQLILMGMGASSKRRTVLLPEYLCEDAFYPYIKAARMDFISYPIDFKLQPRIDPAQVMKADAVVFINYFGCIDSLASAQKIKSMKPSMSVIIDYSQDAETFHSMDKPPHGVDFAFTSYRKFFPTVSGGGLKSTGTLRNALPQISVIRQGTWQDALFQATLLKKKMLNSSDSRIAVEFLRNFNLYRERFQKVGLPESIDSLSLEILRMQDFSAVFDKRKRNYAHLSERIKRINGLKSVFIDAPVSRAPLFLPVLVPGRRNALVKFLRTENIFCPVHWPLDPARRVSLSHSALEFYDQGLSLLIDQRMDERDLDLVSDKIEEFLDN